jgi:hypothetical protein
MSPSIRERLPSAEFLESLAAALMSLSPKDRTRLAAMLTGQGESGAREGHRP